MCRNTSGRRQNSILIVTRKEPLVKCLHCWPMNVDYIIVRILTSEYFKNATARKGAVLVWLHHHNHIANFKVASVLEPGPMFNPVRHVSKGPFPPDVLPHAS